MKYWDISLDIFPGMVTWPGHPPVLVEQYRSLARGESSNSSSVAFSVHTGTHVDAPVHFLPGGTSIDKIDLSAMIGEAMVVELPNVDEVTEKNLAALDLPKDLSRILFKTKNSQLWARGDKEFSPRYVSLSTGGAEWLADRKYQLVGIDYLSIQKFRDKSSRTHEVLLSRGITILEGIDLHQVPAGRYHLTCLPLKILGVDGAPARAILTKPA